MTFGSWAEPIWIVEVLIFLLSSLRALIHFPPLLDGPGCFRQPISRFNQSCSISILRYAFFFLFLLLFSPPTFSLMRAAPMETRKRESECAQRGWLIHFPTSLFSISTCLLLSVSKMGLETSNQTEEEKKKKKLCERVGPKKTSVDCLIPRSSPSSTFLLPIDFTTTPSVWYSLAAVYNFDVLPPFRMRPTGLLLLLLQRLLLLRRLARPAVLLPH